MNYETLKMYENDKLRQGVTGSNAIHLAANLLWQPTIGYGYDLRQNGFSANGLNSKVGRTVITQEQMDQIKSYSNSKPAEGTPEYKAYLSLMASITITEAEATRLLQIKVNEYELALNTILSKHNVSLNEKLVSFRFSLAILFAVFLFIPAYNANAKVLPSFECVKATTEVEKLICSDDELATLDLEMNKSYHAFMKTLDEKYYREKLKRKQIDWLGYRGKLSCFNTDNSKKAPCLKNTYQRRIENLNAWASRKNYNFFIDYPDYYEQSKRIGYRKDMGKFISQLGEEYYIQCKKDIIIPKLPEEKVYFDDFPGPLPYMNSYVEINHTEENFIYFRCSEIQEIKEDKSLTEFSMNMINHTYGNLKIYPKDEDDKDDIIKFIKEEAIQNNNIEIIKLIKNNKALLPTALFDAT